MVMSARHMLCIVVGLWSAASAHALDSFFFASRSRTSLLAQLKDALFARSPSGWQPRAFCRDFFAQRRPAPYD